TLGRRARGTGIGEQGRGETGALWGQKPANRREREMRRKLSVLGLVATLALGLMVFTVPPDAQADPFTVDRITITVGTNVWCAGIAGACTGVVAGGGALLATLPGAGVLLNPGQTLVLTQTGGGTTFNFDTSDFCPGGTCPNPVLNVRTNLTGAAGVNFV